MTRRQLTNSCAICIVLSIILIFGLNGFAPSKHGENLKMAQYQPPGLVQFPQESNTSFLFRNETSYLTALKNGTSLKEPFAVHAFGGINSVNVSATNPPGINIMISPSKVVLQGSVATQTGYFTIGSYNLTLETTIPGTYNFVVTATNGTISNSITITAIVTDGPDFVVLPSYPYSAFSVGQLGSPEGYAGDLIEQAIMVWSTGFQGQVSLSTQVSPQGPSTALSLSSNIDQPGDLSSQTVSRYVQANAKNYTILSLNSTQAADYTVTVNGAAGVRIHSATVLFRVRDFNLSFSSITSATLDVGSSFQSQVYVRSLNGFSSIVNLTASAPPGFSVTLSSDSINGSGAVVMKVINKSASPGLYSFTVNAMTTRFFTHSATFTIQVPLVPAYILPWIGAGSIASIGAGVYLLLRRKTSKPPGL